MYPTTNLINIKLCSRSSYEFRRVCLRRVFAKVSLTIYQHSVSVHFTIRVQNWRKNTAVALKQKQNTDVISVKWMNKWYIITCHNVLLIGFRCSFYSNFDRHILVPSTNIGKRYNWCSFWIHLFKRLLKFSVFPIICQLIYRTAAKNDGSYPHLVVPVPDGDGVLGPVIVVQRADVVGLRPPHNQCTEQPASIVKPCTRQIHYYYTVYISNHRYF